MPMEFEFIAEPEFGDKATRYLLRRRGGRWGPFAIILLPILIAILAADPAMRPAAYVFSGAVIMLLVIFLLAMAQRRRIRRRFFESTTDHTVRVSLDDAGLAIRSAAGASTLPWESITRVWAGEDVVLLFYHGWSYIAFPRKAIPPAALDEISSKTGASAAP